MNSDQRTNGQFYNSRYNVAYAEGGDVFLFNTRTCGFMKLKGKSVDDFDWLTDSSPRPISSEGIPDELRERLREGGFVIPENADELEMIKFRHKLAHATSFDTCAIVVIPTLRCNMKCSYCFEKNKTLPVMSEEIQGQLVDYVKDRLEGGCRNVSIEWFGGEPLLCLSVIRSLSRKFIRLCKKYKASYSASMISNGTLLSRKVAKSLRRLKVQNVQITLDGPPEVNDRRRPFQDGEGTFDLILKNIEEAHDLLDISIRCNIDESNLPHAEVLADILSRKGLPPHVRLYFSPVHKGVAICGDAGKGCGTIYTQEAFAELEFFLMSIVQERGFRGEPRPSPAASSCAATFLGSFVVDAEGNLYKCSLTAGVKEEIVGTLADGFNFNDKLFRWTNFDALSYAKCRDCKYLPMCMGWCPANVWNDPDEESCMRIRYNLIKQLKLTHSNIQERKEDRDEIIRHEGGGKQGGSGNARAGEGRVDSAPGRA